MGYSLIKYYAYFFKILKNTHFIMEKDSETNLVLMIFKEYIFKHWEKLVKFF